MPNAVVNLPSLTIPSGQTDSSALGALDDACSLTIFAPSALTGTVTLHVEPTSTGTSFVAQQSGGSDVTIPANKATTIAFPAFKQLKLISGAAEGSDRVFQFCKNIR